MKERYPASYEEMRRHFDFFDDDNNGVIDTGEFLDLLRIMGDDTAAQTVSLNFARIDTDGDGLISFGEFRRWWTGVHFDPD